MSNHLAQYIFTSLFSAWNVNQTPPASLELQLNPNPPTWLHECLAKSQNTKTFFQAMDWLDLMIKTQMDNAPPPLQTLSLAFLNQSVLNTEHTDNGLYIQTNPRARETHDPCECFNQCLLGVVQVNFPSKTCLHTWVQKKTLMTRKKYI